VTHGVHQYIGRTQARFTLRPAPLPVRPT
jgi:hypothetical protein